MNSLAVIKVKDRAFKLHEVTILIKAVCFI